MSQNATITAAVEPCKDLTTRGVSPVRSIMFGVKGQNSAFTNTMKLLTYQAWSADSCLVKRRRLCTWQVRPENPAEYSHDYMKQAGSECKVQDSKVVSTTLACSFLQLGSISSSPRQAQWVERNGLAALFRIPGSVPQKDWRECGAPGLLLELPHPPSRIMPSYNTDANKEPCLLVSC